MLQLQTQNRAAPLLRLPSVCDSHRAAAPKPPLQRIPIFLDLNRSGVLSSGCAQKVPDILNFVAGGTEASGREDTLLHTFLKKWFFASLFLMLRLSSALDFISKSQSKKTEVHETLSCGSPWLCSFKCSFRCSQANLICWTEYS